MQGDTPMYADAAARNVENDTPLFLAVLSNKLEIVKLIAEAVSNRVNISNVEGRASSLPSALITRPTLSHSRRASSSCSPGDPRTVAQGRRRPRCARRGRGTDLRPEDSNDGRPPIPELRGKPRRP